MEHLSLHHVMIHVRFVTATMVSLTVLFMVAQHHPDYQDVSRYVMMVNAAHRMSIAQVLYSIMSRHRVLDVGI